MASFPAREELDKGEDKVRDSPPFPPSSPFWEAAPISIARSLDSTGEQVTHHSGLTGRGGRQKRGKGARKECYFKLNCMLCRKVIS